MSAIVRILRMKQRRTGRRLFGFLLVLIMINDRTRFVNFGLKRASSAALFGDFRVTVRRDGRLWKIRFFTVMLRLGVGRIATGYCCNTDLCLLTRICVSVNRIKVNRFMLTMTCRLVSTIHLIVTGTDCHS